MIVVEVHDEMFHTWLRRVELGFNDMIETMMRVSEEIKEQAQLNAPIDTGRLSRSYREKVITNNSKMIVLQVQMSALNPRNGFDYAFVQHRGYHISKNGWTVYYHRDKLVDLGFYTYSPNILGKGYDTNNSSLDAWELQRGQNQYLFWAIKGSQDSAFEMLEEDYLSLFERGHI